MSAVIVLAFGLCWLPFIVFHFVNLHFQSSIPRCSVGYVIFSQFAILLSLCHCILNPCICFSFMPRIRTVLKPSTTAKIKRLAFLETRF